MENLRRLYYEVFWDNWVLTCPMLVPLALLELAFRSDPNGFELMTKRQEQKKTEVAIADALIEWLNSVRKNYSVYIFLDKICLIHIKLGLYTGLKLLLTSYNDVWRKVKFFGHLENIFGGIKDRLNYVLVINCQKLPPRKFLFSTLNVVSILGLVIFLLFLPFRFQTFIREYSTVYHSLDRC